MQASDRQIQMVASLIRSIASPWLWSGNYQKAIVPKSNYFLLFWILTVFEWTPIIRASNKRRFSKLLMRIFLINEKALLFVLAKEPLKVEGNSGVLHESVETHIKIMN